MCVIARASDTAHSKKRMKQGVLSQTQCMHADCRACMHCVTDTPQATSRGCTAAVEATPNGCVFPAPHKPDCAKLRKLGSPSRTLARRVAQRSPTRRGQFKGDRAMHCVHARAGNEPVVSHTRFACFPSMRKPERRHVALPSAWEVEGMRARRTWRAGSTPLSFPAPTGVGLVSATEWGAPKRIHASTRASLTGPVQGVFAGPSERRGVIPSNSAFTLAQTGRTRYGSSGADSPSLQSRAQAGGLCCRTLARTILRRVPDDGFRYRRPQSTKPAAVQRKPASPRRGRDPCETPNECDARSAPGVARAARARAHGVSCRLLPAARRSRPGRACR